MERDGPILRGFEGHRVDVTLRDGTTIDGCLLVSSGRLRVLTLWLVVDGDDLFVLLNDVVNIAASRSHVHAAA
jgi:hypothetical protein